MRPIDKVFRWQERSGAKGGRFAEVVQRQKNSGVGEKPCRYRAKERGPRAKDLSDGYQIEQGLKNGSEESLKN